jgi:hypothetical protein
MAARTLPLRAASAVVSGAREPLPNGQYVVPASRCVADGLTVEPFRGACRAGGCAVTLMARPPGLDGAKGGGALRGVPRATVTDIDTQQIRRKPVLNGLINEYTHAA